MAEQLLPPEEVKTMVLAGTAVLTRVVPEEAVVEQALQEGEAAVQVLAKVPQMAVVVVVVQVPSILDYNPFL